MTLTTEDKRWIESNLQSTLAHQLEQLETKLLTAFRDWAEPIDGKLRSHSGSLAAQSQSIAALELEIASLRDRVAKLEGTKR